MTEIKVVASLKFPETSVAGIQQGEVNGVVEIDHISLVVDTSLDFHG